MRELTPLQKQVQDSTWRHYKTGLLIAKGNLRAAEAFFTAQRGWSDHQFLKAAVTSNDTNSFASAKQTIGTYFLANVGSALLRIQGFQTADFNTRIFVDAVGVTSALIAEGAQTPVVSGNFSTTLLERKKFVGLEVLTDELAQSMSNSASEGLRGDLEKSVRLSMDYGFLSITNGIFSGALNFSGGSFSVTNLDADLKRQHDLMPRGSAYVMARTTHSAALFARTTNGDRAFPDLKADNGDGDGGFLYGLPLYITEACELVGSPTSNIVGLISAQDIIVASKPEVEILASKNASLQMSDAPSTSPANLVSMFQANSTALKATVWHSWFPRNSRAATYFRVNY